MTLAYVKNQSTNQPTYLYFNSTRSFTTVFLSSEILAYSDTCHKQPLKNRHRNEVLTGGSLMQLESIAECSEH